VQRAESEPESAAPPSHKRRNPGRASKLIISGAVALFVGLPVAALTAWQLDEKRYSGRVAQNTSLAGTNISGHRSEQLQAELIALQQQVRADAIEIGHEGQSFSASTNEFALDLDIDATREAVLRFGHDERAIRRFGKWISGRFDNNEAPVVVRLDEAKLTALVSEKDPGPRTPPSNPSIDFQNGEFVAVEGSDGKGLINAQAASAVRAAVRKGFPLRAHLDSGDLPALATSNDIDALIQDAQTISKQPLNVSAENKQATVSEQQLKEMIIARAAGDHLRIDVEPDEAERVLGELLSEAGTKPVEAGYDVVDDKPVMVDGKPGTKCCAEGAAGVIGDALVARLSGADPNAVTPLPMTPVAPSTKATDLPDLGIKEKVGTFTTYHPKNQPRVTNIHLISDLTRGSIVKPGEKFSINDRVGKRTAEKGFVSDHVIEDGKFKDDIGGGISQYATTLFNAAFFAGLDFGEYQSHSIYIERYPYGREATVSFPHPDMQVKNNTPYGLLIWPTYTDSSLTISIYSTKFATGEQTGQTTSPAGQCTRVRTERTRTYVDGRPPTKDTVGALYQPKEGERC
jgi:vancomycin resistance protein YoaR